VGVAARGGGAGGGDVDGLSWTTGVGGGGDSLGTRAGGGASERGSGRYSWRGCAPVAAGSRRGVV